MLHFVPQLVPILGTQTSTRIINAATSNGKISLIFAAISGHADTCEILLAVPGVLGNAQDIEGKTALYHASCLGHGEVAKILRGCW